ncbi:MAG: hypothetical protein ABEI97_02000, partial [Candidatus Nanohaloarchaea archaeon]
MAQQQIQYDKKKASTKPAVTPDAGGKPRGRSISDTGVVDVTVRHRGEAVDVELRKVTLTGNRDGDTISISEEASTEQHTVLHVDEVYSEVVADLAAVWMATIPLPEDIPQTAFTGDIRPGVAEREEESSRRPIPVTLPPRPFNVATESRPDGAAYPAPDTVDRRPRYAVEQLETEQGRPLLQGLPRPADLGVRQRWEDDDFGDPGGYTAPDRPALAGAPAPQVVEQRYDLEDGDVERSLSYTVQPGQDAAETLQQLMAQELVQGSVEAMTYTVSERFEDENGEIREPGETVESYFVDLDGSDMRRTEFFVDGELAEHSIDSYDTTGATVTFVEADQFEGDDGYCGDLDIHE